MCHSYASRSPGYFGSATAFLLSKQELGILFGVPLSRQWQ